MYLSLALTISGNFLFVSLSRVEASRVAVPIYEASVGGGQDYLKSGQHNLIYSAIEFLSHAYASCLLFPEPYVHSSLVEEGEKDIILLMYRSTVCSP
jgi:hypothetical protein